MYNFTVIFLEKKKIGYILFIFTRFLYEIKML